MARSEFTDETEQQAKGESFAPVQSDYPIPLFPDYGRDNRHVIQKILVFKMSGPNDGFKGEIAPTSTLAFIGRTFGNGIYDLHAVSGEGKVLRRAQNVKVDLPAEPSGAVRMAPPPRDTELTLLTFQRDQHEKDAERVATFARESTEQNREMTNRHLSMVERTTEAQMSRDREFFAAQTQMQRDFFANLMAFQQQSHQQTIVMLETSYQRMLQQNDPMTLITLFQQGLQAGQGLVQDEQNPLLSAMSKGVEGLEKMRQMMILKNPAPARTLPKGDPSRTAPKPGADPRQLDAQTLAKIARLKAKIEAKGYEWDSALAQIELLVEGHAAAEDDPDMDPEEETEEPNAGSDAGGDSEASRSP